MRQQGDERVGVGKWHGRPCRSGPDRLPPATLHGDDRGLLASNRRYPRVMVDTRYVRRATRGHARCNHGVDRVRSDIFTAPTCRAEWASTVGIAVVFPGQGTQQPGMALAVARPPELEGRRAGRSRARRAARAPPHRRARRALARTREAQLAVLLTSLVAWEALAPLAERRRRVRRPLARPGHRARSRRACSPSTTACASRPGAPSSRRPRPTRIPAGWPRCSARRSSRPRTRAPRHPTACWVANDNAPGPGRDRRHARRPRRRDRPGPRSSA